MQKLDKLDLNSLTKNELKTLVQQWNQPSFRATQLYQWIHQKGVHDPNQMGNIPKAMISKLIQHYRLAPVSIKRTQISDDGTQKYLFSLDDHETIETVLISEKSRNTVCVSSQVGCAMGCTFCATGLQGFLRNLTAGEITAQGEHVQRLLQIANQGHVTNIVFMGMGEPLANYDNLLRAISILNDPLGLNIGMRRVTISTCGIVPKIYQLAKDSNQVNLAISLHAPDDNKRSEVMPINQRYPISEVLDACQFYVEKTNRRVSFEYALIHGFNDTQADLSQLVEILSNLLCHVNVIPVNPVNDDFQRPTSKQVIAFVDYLQNHNIPASVRRERGTDIAAACGQLRQAQQEG